MELRAHPALRYLIVLVLGILSADFIKLPSDTLFFSAFLLSILIFVSFLKPKLSNFRFALLPFFYLLGLISVFFYDDLNKSNHYLHQSKFGKYLAVIDSPTEVKPKSYKVTAKVMAIEKDHKQFSASGQVILYFNKQAEVIPQYGDVFLIKNNLREIEPPKNPFEFDYKKYQNRKNIYSHQFLREGDFVRTGTRILNPILNFAYSLNRYTHSVFKSILNTSRELGVAEALIAGMKSDLDFETRQWYSATGSIHVLAVSGMHVAILFWVINAGFGLFLNRKKAPFIFSVLAILWAYAVFTGLSPSVVRATIMFSMIQMGIYFNRDGDSLNTLLVSAIVILVFMPNWIYEVGFQLSYLAVAGILVLLPVLNRVLVFQNRTIRWIWEISMVSVSAQIFTLPLTIYYFHQFPNYFLLANPLVSILSSVILPLGLTVLLVFKIPFFGIFMGSILKYLLMTLNFSVYLIQDLPYSLTSGYSISMMTVLGLFFIIFLFIKYLKVPETYLLKTISVIVILLFGQAAFKTFQQNQQNEITFHFIPNGWGLTKIEGRNATFISTDSLAHEPLIYQYHLKNYYDAKGINHSKFLSVQDKGNWVITDDNGKKIQWIKGKVETEILSDVDYLLISGNAIREFEKLKNFQGKIIFDGSNSKRTIDRIKEKAGTNNTKLIFLYDNGSVTFKI